MKTKRSIYFLFVILNISISINLFSQPYKSIFGSQSTQWNEFTYNLSSWTCFLNTINDTIIGSKTYKKIAYSGICPTENNIVFLREDTITGKAWAYELSHSDERLIMDLSLNVGDTFRIYPNSIYYDTIVIVDSIYYENSLKKVRLNINTYFPGNEKLTFIEGVGTNIGIDYQVNSYFFDNMGSIYLLCSYKNSVLEYLNMFTDSCSFNGVGLNEIISKNRISIFPNPTADFINVSLPFHIIGKIVIYDSFGRIIITSSVNGYNSNFKFDVGHWSNGLYFIQFIGENEKANILFNRFIKN